MLRTASAVWTGSLKEGNGNISTESGMLTNTPYNIHTRFEDGAGTNPEELLGAAYAGCFNMEFAAQLGEVGIVADRITTFASVTLEKVEVGFSITAVHLDVTAKIPNADRKIFDAVAIKAKACCPVSKVLNTRISLDAKLEV